MQDKDECEGVNKLALQYVIILHCAQLPGVMREMINNDKKIYKRQSSRRLRLLYIGRRMAHQFIKKLSLLLFRMSERWV